LRSRYGRRAWKVEPGIEEQGLDFRHHQPCWQSVGLCLMPGGFDLMGRIV
jgi:hypothetical protein